MKSDKTSEGFNTDKSKSKYYVDKFQSSLHHATLPFHPTREGRSVRRKTERMSPLSMYSSTLNVGLAAAAPVVAVAGLPLVKLGSLLPATSASLGTLATAGAVGGAIVWLPAIFVHCLINDFLADKHPNVAFGLNAILFLGSAYASLAIGALIYKLPLEATQSLMFSGNLGIYGPIIAVALFVAISCAIVAGAKASVNYGVKQYKAYQDNKTSGYEAVSTQDPNGGDDEEEIELRQYQQSKGVYQPATFKPADSRQQSRDTAREVSGYNI